MSLAGATPSARCHRRSAGFTLVELMVALLLLALISGVLYGSLSLSASSWDKGEAKADQAGDMRQTAEFLRQALAAEHPLRLHKAVDQPLYFACLCRGDAGASGRRHLLLPGRPCGQRTIVEVTAFADDPRLQRPQAAVVRYL